MRLQYQSHTQHVRQSTTIPVAVARYVINPAKDYYVPKITSKNVGSPDGQIEPEGTQENLCRPDVGDQPEHMIPEGPSHHYGEGAPLEKINTRPRGHYRQKSKADQAEHRCNPRNIDQAKQSNKMGQAEETTTEAEHVPYVSTGGPCHHYGEGAPPLNK